MSKVVRLHNEDIQQDLKFSRFLYSFPRVNLGSLVITFICIIGMIVATFTQMPVGIYNVELLADPSGYFSDFNNVLLTLHSQLYSLQIPVAIFAGALLGPRLGTFAISVYVALGLFGVPLFAGGGGGNYIYQPLFGFIIGFVLSAFLVGKAFSKKVSSIDIIFAALLGVVTAHFCGVIYLIGNLYFTGYSLEYIKAWVWGISFINLPYDILFGLVACAIARPIRGFLWVTIE